MRLTEQSIFNKVIRCLRKQGGRATTKEGTCVYRAADGRRCAFGCLITNKEYRPYFEGAGAYGLINNSGNPTLHRYLPFLILIKELQLAHDCHMPEQWELRWAKIAREFNLTLPSKA